MSTGRLGAGDTAIQPTIFDAKGDLLTATAGDTPARIAVGNNGETLVADSSASTGLRWQGNYAAGKNAIINGDFRINQRGFSSSTSGDFVFDRWASSISGGTVTSSAQTFTAGTAPVAGYEAINFYRIATTGQSAAGDFALIRTRLEDSRLFANQTVTISFWAKANSGTPKVAIEIQQNFGSGGSTSVNTYAGQVTLSTSWSRYSVTVALPSISGKTLGTGNFLTPNFWVSAGTTFDARTGSLGIQTNTFDFWGMQLEAGNVATAFQTATGTLAGELAAAQRYCVAYGKNQGDTTLANALSGIGVTTSTTEYQVAYYLPVKMRAIPTLTYSGTSNHRGSAGLIANTGAALGIGASSQIVNVGFTVASGLTANQWAMARQDSSGTGSVLFEAEL